MKSRAEAAAVFECAGQKLVSIVHPTENGSRIGVVIVVGGPQYRVGSHRQFVYTARALATSGYPVLRFDYRGMGDSEGEPRTFDSVSVDIRCAIDYLTAALGVDGVVLFGLCDAASASLIYCPTDDRVRGLILLNPWVHTTQGEARSFLRHYYLERLLSWSFWRKVVSGQFAASQSVRELGQSVVAAGQPYRLSGGRGSFIDQMYRGLAAFAGEVLFLISDWDLTAREFMDHCARDERWKTALTRNNVELRTLANADHTLSTRAELDRANEHCVRWLQAKWSLTS
jgi:exosortase A-associated hydrolase 1